MTTIESAGMKSGSVQKVLVRLLVGAACGAVMGVSVVLLAKQLMVPVKHLGWADFLALVLGVLFLGVGLVMYAMSFNRRQLGRSLEGEAAQLPASDDEARDFRGWCASMMLAGLMLLLVLLSSGSLGSTRGRAGLLFGVVVALFLAQMYVNVRVWRTADEFVRAQAMQTGAICFGLAQGALFLWAAAEHLHLVAAISSWDILTLLLTLYLGTSLTLARRTRPGSR